MKNNNHPLPVIFLAFANDHQSYLYKLTEEQDGIRSALKAAEAANLCEVVYETDCDIDKIFRVFDQYQDRIAVFHYGGHAEDYSLLLKAASGKRQHAHSEGLVSFLAEQKGLQLVFINGCSSQTQAEMLRDKGIPAVIATSQPIDDAAATLISTQFYRGLAAGRTIDQAWKMAAARVKTEKDNGENFRAGGVFQKSKADVRISFPWALYLRPGEVSVKDWNLPRASRNPLFSLPLPETYFRNLPPAPFPGLHYFQQKDAAIFFGRGGQVRELYNHITGVHPVILFYGKSGVGKSSLLYAGLLPRIEDKFSVIYLRRNQELGLAGTLLQALETQIKLEDAPEKILEQRENTLEALSELKEKIQEKPVLAEIETLIANLRQNLPASPETLPTLLKRWQAFELQSGKPLIVILDQVEEKFTKPMPDRQESSDELFQFLHTIQPLFSANAKTINGKLILSYRKEFHPEIRDAFQMMSLPYAEVFLKRLDRDGIMEAVYGASREKNIQSKYRLAVEETPDNNLPAIIADDLLVDNESPIAPVLQIILKKLWDSAKEKNDAAPELTVAAYRQHKKAGITMGEFFQQQMAELARALPKAVSSGLALDMLYAHTTAMGTAGRCRREALAARYPDRQKIIDQLVQSCIDLSLLLRIDDNATILAHDTLAPVVINAYNSSDTPGQRAARILSSKLSEFSGKRSKLYLDENDLAVVEAGRYGMPALDASGEQLLAASRDLQTKRQQQRNYVRLGIVGLIVAVSLAAWMWYQADLSAKRAELEDRRSRSQYLSIKARELANEDNTVALRLMEHAYGLVAEDPPASVAQTLSKIYENRDQASFYEHNFQHTSWVKSAQFSPDGEKILTRSFSSTGHFAYEARIWDRRSGERLHTFEYIREATYSPDGRYVLTLASRDAQDNSTRLWDANSGDARSIISHTIKPGSAIFSPDGEKILISYHHSDSLNFLQIYSLAGDSLTTIQDAHRPVFSPDSKYLLTGAPGNNIRLSTVTGKTVAALKHPSSVKTHMFSPDGQTILTGYSEVSGNTTEGHLQLWSLDGEVLAEIRYHSYLKLATFSSDGKEIFTSWQDNTVQKWQPMTDNKLALVLSHDERIATVLLSPDDKALLCWSENSLVLRPQIQLVQSRPQELPHDGHVRSLSFSSDGRLVLTSADDNTARLWDADSGDLLNVFAHNDDDRGEVYTAVFSPDGQHVLTASEDGTAKLWPIDGPFQKLPLAGGQFAGIKHFEGTQTWLKNGFTTATFSPDGQRFVTGSAYGHSRLWDTNSSRETHVLTPPIRQSQGVFTTGNPVIAVAFSPDGQRVLTASHRGDVRLWSLAGDSLGILPHGRKVFLAKFSPDGHRILTTTYGTALLWQNDGETVDTLKHHQIYAAVFSPDGRQLITTSFASEQSILWDVATGDTLFPVHLEAGREGSDAFSPDGRQLITSSENDSLIIWNTANGKIIGAFAHEDGIVAARFSPDGEQVLIACDNDTTFLWSPKDGVQQTFIHKDEVKAATFSPDGQFILTASADGFANLWSLDGKALMAFPETEEGGWARFSPDGKLVLTKKGLWSPRGEIVAEFPRYGDRAIFSADGTRLISISGEFDKGGAANFYLTPAGIYQWLQDAPVYRLTDAEKETYGIVE